LDSGRVVISIDGNNNLNTQDAYKFWIGKPKLFTTSDIERIIKNSITGSQWVFTDTIIIDNGPVDSTLFRGNDIRIKIPDSLGITWATFPNFYWTEGNGSLDTTAGDTNFTAETKIVTVPISKSFEKDQKILITDAHFEVGNPSLPDNFALSLHPEAFHTFSGFDVSVSDPSFSSGENQVFVVGDSIVVLKPITYYEDPLTPGLVDRNIYLKIPDTLYMKWSAEFEIDLTINNGGPFSPDTINGFSSDVLKIELDSSLTASDILTISGLELAGFNARNDSLYLEYSLLDASRYASSSRFHDEDPTWIAIGQPKINLENDYNLLVKNTEYVNLSVSEDGVYKTIHDSINLYLPDQFSGVWGDSSGLISISPDDPMDSSVVNGRKLTLFFSDPPSIGDTLQIHDISVTTQYDIFYVDSLSGVKDYIRIGVTDNKKSFPYIPEDLPDLSKIQVGKPTIRIPEDYNILLDNVNSVKLLPITIAEDSQAPVVNISRDSIIIKLPDEISTYWDTSVPIVQLSGSAYNLVSPIPMYNGNSVSFEINGSFLEEDSLIINGLYITPPDRVGSGVLSLSLNDKISDCDSTINNIQVGNVDFSSEEEQFFSKNSSDRKLNDITILQDTTLPLIEDRIIIKIPRELKVKWDSFNISDTLASINDEEINVDSIRYNHSFKELFIIDSTFMGAYSIIIRGLYFEGLTDSVLTESSEGFLELSLEEKTNSLILIDTCKKTIGGPSIYSQESSAFVVGESDEYAMIEPIIIKEDEVVPVLSQFRSLEIVIPDSVKNFTWNNTLNSVQINTDSVSVTYQDQGKTVSVPLDSSITSPLDTGSVLILNGLGLDTIRRGHEGFHLMFDFILNEGGTVPRLTDEEAQIRAGTLTIDLDYSVDNPLGTYLSYILPKITIEDTNNLLGMKRALVLILSDSLKPIANWQFDDQHYNSEIDSISVIEETLKVFFNSTLSNNKVTLDSLKLTTDKIYGNSAEIQADSLVHYFEPETGVIEISTQRADVGYNPMVLDVSKETIEFYPPVILTKPEFYNRADTTIISFATSPGMFHPDSTFLPPMFQIVRTPWGTNDTILFSDTSSSSVSIENSDWSFSGSITVLDMPFVIISLSEKDLERLNLWFDEMHYYDKSFEHFLDVNKATLPINQSSDFAERTTDSSSINWLHYNPELISFSKKERIISNDELDDFILNLGDVFPDSIQIKLLGRMTDTDTTVLLTDSSVSLFLFSPIQNDDLYTLRITSQDSSEKGIVPIIRQFIVDNKQPQLVDILPKTGRSKSGGGHEVSKSENISLSYQENLSVVKNLSNYSIQFSEEDTVLSTVFPFPDSLEVFIRIDWSEDLSYHNTNFDTLYVDRTRSKAPNWSMQLDSLLYFLVEDDSLIAGLERMNAKILFTLSDYTINTDADSVEYAILLNVNRLLGSEVFNYPNPFPVDNELTHIRYVINKEGLNKGKFIIFDAGGDVVYYNNNINLGIGTHDDLTWGGTDLRGNKLASGIYFGFLEIENEKPVRIKIAIINR
ncbi:MAG: hypothetical protein H8D45_06595, partial [Bacteroidetes bacterium]|nr:hypothetical protein [Bacteroidota bacterium]